MGHSKGPAQEKDSKRSKSTYMLLHELQPSCLDWLLEHSTTPPLVRVFGDTAATFPKKTLL